MFVRCQEDGSYFCPVKTSTMVPPSPPFSRREPWRRRQLPLTDAARFFWAVVCIPPATSRVVARNQQASCPQPWPLMTTTLTIIPASCCAGRRKRMTLDVLTLSPCVQVILGEAERNYNRVFICGHCLMTLLSSLTWNSKKKGAISLPSAKSFIWKSPTLLISTRCTKTWKVKNYSRFSNISSVSLHQTSLFQLSSMSCTATL